MFYRNLLQPRDIRFSRRPATGQSRDALSPWLPPSSYGRGGSSGYIFHQVATRGSCASRAASCSPLSVLPAPGNFRSDWVWDRWTARKHRTTAGNSVPLQETASHALPEKHKRATVVRQIGQKLLQLLRGGLVLEHARRVVSLTRRRPPQRCQKYNIFLRRLLQAVEGGLLSSLSGGGA
jgi:hypothetical protein